MCFVKRVSFLLGTSTRDFNMILLRSVITELTSKTNTIAQSNGCSVILTLYPATAIHHHIAALAKQPFHTILRHLKYTNTYTRPLRGLTGTVCLTAPGLGKKTQTQAMSVLVLRISTEILLINSVMTVLMSITMLATDAMILNVLDAQQRI